MAEWRRELDRRCAAAALEPSQRDVVQRELEEHLDVRFVDLVAGGATPDNASRTVVRSEERRGGKECA